LIIARFTHGLRHGRHSFAASRLGIADLGAVTEPKAEFCYRQTIKPRLGEGFAMSFCRFRAD